MRLILILTAALLVAGCTESSDPPAAETTPTPTLDPVSPASDEEEKPAPTTPPTPPAEEEPVEPTPEDENDTFVPPAPVAKPWELNEQVSLGWVAAVGSGGQGDVESAGQKDGTHCPDAMFALPEGAAELTITVTSTMVDPEGAAAGQYVIRITAPDGTVTEVAPPQPDPQSSAEAAALTWTTSEPGIGSWTLTAVPLGPVVQQSWPASILATGASIEPPTTLGAATTC